MTTDQTDIKDVVSVNFIEEVLKYLQEIGAEEEYTKLHTVYIQILDLAKGGGYKI